MITSSTMDRAAFLRRLAAAGLLAAAGSLPATDRAAAATAATPAGPGDPAGAVPVGAVPARRRRPGLTYRGVAYDTGTEYFGSPGRPVWTEALLAADLRAIQRGLGCNSVTVFGTEVDRLVQTSALALGRGLQVSVQPRLFDHPQPEILEHLRRTARQAERLRRGFAPEVILIIGCEYLLFTPGIVPGETFLDRITYLLAGPRDWAEIQARLDTFVAAAVEVARRQFAGRISYASIADAEEIDWSLFDIVGLDYYTFHRDPREHTRDLAPHRRWRKPILITEFGCCTYVGAAERGGDGWDVVDWDQDPPQIIGDVVRSEREQATHIATMLDVFEAEGFLGASPYTFIAPDLPHSRTPRFDLDRGSFSLVKVIRERHTDPASPYHWEPKQSFHAVARHNRAAAAASTTPAWPHPR